MKKTLLNLILIYQKFISPVYKMLFGISASCRFSPTCSDYAIQSMNKYGVLKGLQLSFKRALTCNPYLGKASNI